MMKKSLFLVGVIGCLGNLAGNAAPIGELAVLSNYQLASEPLTTERVFKLDPDQPNPHLQRWFLHRTVEWVGLKGVPLSDGKYGAQVEAVRSSTVGYLRGGGPWYRSKSEFSCEREPNSWFFTEEGAKQALTFAEKSWGNLIETNRDQLSILLDRVRAESEDAAVELARNLLNQWLARMTYEWRTKIKPAARNQEWKYFISEAGPLEKCQKKSVSVPSPQSLLEPISKDPPLPITKILARAPARLWNGLFSVRVGVRIEGKNLNGKFLIDSGARMSIISPSWLQSQGINPAWVEIPSAMPWRVIWSGIWNSEAGLAKRARVDRVELSGLTIPLNEFLLAETEFFTAPENVGSCCDGVLGVDFIRKYALEFQPHVPYEVKIWPAEGFHLPADTPRVEISQSEAGEIVSSCTVVPQKKLLKQKAVQLQGLRWETGSEDPLSIHTPWQSVAENVTPNSWDIQCDSLKIASSVIAQFSKPLGGPNDFGPHAAKYPAVSVGVGLLNRGNFTFDLPHGQLWFSKEALETAAPKMNRTGLKLEYVVEDGERLLKVKTIQAQSAASFLERQGLKAGMVITQMDSKPSEEMDIWEVESRLAGQYGEVVTLQWKTTPQGRKMAPLQVLGWSKKR